ncbi:MAG: metallophosphoesterase [Candidatus Nanohaloarchaea archaeon]
MNEEAVKELTKQGCMVERDAAEILNSDDVEQIKNLETTPMYVSKNMVEKLREKIEARPEQKQVMTASGTEVEPERPKQKKEEPETQSQKKEEPEEEKASDEIYSNRSSHFSRSKTVKIKDSGSRDRKTTKVEVLDDRDITEGEKDVPEFLGAFNDRYDRMKKMLMRHREMKSATTINRLERRSEGEEATTIGLVKDKYSTRNGKYIVEIEDKTGTFKLLVGEREGDLIVPDEVIGAKGSMGGDIIYADSVVRPDLPIPQGTKTTEQQVKAAYISDLHIGSQDTLHKRLDRFADWLSTEDAKDVGYLVISGDLVEGVGVYPGQDEELEIADIYKQYQAFEQWFEKIPEDIQVIAGPGNHDITRLAEPQPRLDKNVFPSISDYNNFHRVQNPQMVRLHAVESKGIKNLMYHGYSFDQHADQIKELREKAYEQPEHLMIDLLKRRHLAPTFGSNLIAPDSKDPLIIEEEPDVFVAGHFHSHANSSYKGTNVICSSTFQAQTPFQKRVGHEPDPGKVTIVNYKTRNTEVKQF